MHKVVGQKAVKGMQNERDAARTKNLLRQERERNKTLSKELYRVRTTENASAHALDCLRQELGLDLVEGEHPQTTLKRIREKIKSSSGL